MLVHLILIYASYFSRFFWDVLLSSKSKWADIFHEVVKCLSINIWYVQLRVKYLFMRFAFCFSFPFYTASQLYFLLEKTGFAHLCTFWTQMNILSVRLLGPCPLSHRQWDFCSLVRGLTSWFIITWVYCPLRVNINCHFAANTFSIVTEKPLQLMLFCSKMKYSLPPRVNASKHILIDL